MRRWQGVAGRHHRRPGDGGAVMAATTLGMRWQARPAAVGRIVSPCDFDAWAYQMTWPQPPPRTTLRELSTGGAAGGGVALPLLGFASLTVEDIKFAYNAWCLLRLGMYYGTAHPKVLSNLTCVTPPMDLASRGNRLFYQHAQVGGAETSLVDLPRPCGTAPRGEVPVAASEVQQRVSRLGRCTVRVALTPQHPRAMSIYDFSWDHRLLLSRALQRGGAVAVDGAPAAATTPRAGGGGQRGGWSLLQPLWDAGLPVADVGFEIVLGMENGLSQEVVDACDHHLFIPQYGSIGSLSMMSAMAIAVHEAHAAMARQLAEPPPRGSAGAGRRPGEAATAPPRPQGCSSLGHMPQSHSSLAGAPAAAVPLRRPHETDLVAMSNDEIRGLLARRRAGYALQLALVVYNELGDRNTGALMRNLNAFNGEKMLVLNRRKFSRRGAVGTNHLLDVVYRRSMEEAVALGDLDDYVVWVLYPEYPYLRIFDPAGGRGTHPRALGPNDAIRRGTTTKKRRARRDGWDGWVPQCGEEVEAVKASIGAGLGALTFIRPWDRALREWVATCGVLSAAHPLFFARGPAALHEAWARCAGRDVYLDDERSVQGAVEEVCCGGGAGKRGIALVVPEEGSTPHPSCLARAERVVFVAHPSRVSHATQRGLNGALSTAVALATLRRAIDARPPHRRDHCPAPEARSRRADDDGKRHE